MTYKNYECEKCGMLFKATKENDDNDIRCPRCSSLAVTEKAEKSAYLWSSRMQKSGYS